MPSPPPKKKTTLFLTAEQIRALKAEAALSGLSASELVEEMLRVRQASTRKPRLVAKGESV